MDDDDPIFPAWFTDLPDEDETDPGELLVEWDPPEPILFDPSGAPILWTKEPAGYRLR